MNRVSLNSVAAGFFALGLSLTPFSAQAEPQLVLPNLNFLNYSGSAPKNSFSNVKPDGWTGGGGLIFIDTPGDSSNASSACGSTYLTTALCPGALSIPGGYNYVEADGNPTYESGFNYALTGLTIGQTYELSFYQGASQQAGFGNGLNTTEQWIVSLGTAGMTACFGCGAADPYYGGNDSTYSNSDGTASIAQTTLMTTAPDGLTDWNYVTVDLTADAVDDTLSFLAWGDNGNTINLPPILFLTGVNSQDGFQTPEPASVALLASGLFGLGVAAIRRRRKA